MRSNSNPGRGGSRSYVEIRLGSQFTPGVRALLAVFALSYLAGLIPPLHTWIVQHLILRPAAAIGRAPYQLLAAPLLMSSLLSLLFLGLLLWQIGSAIEERIGTRKFLWWSGSTLYVAPLVTALVGRLWPSQATLLLPIDGHPLFPLLLLLFAQYYGSAQTRLWGIGEPLSGRTMAYFFVGLGVAMPLFAGHWLALVMQLAAIGWTLLLLRQPWQGLRRTPKRKLKAVEGGGGPFRAKPGEAQWLN